MTREERREAMDQTTVERLWARLARIKAAIAIKRANELMATMPPNLIESALLRARLEGGPNRERRKAGG